MMISPEWFKSNHEKDSYEQLLEERDKLIDDIRRFERDGTYLGEEFCSPSPEIRYQHYLLFLARICELIEAKHSERCSEEFRVFLQGVLEERDKRKQKNKQNYL